MNETLIEQIQADASALDIFQFIEPPRTSQQISHDKQFPLASDQGDSRCYRASGHFFFCQHLFTSNSSNLNVIFKL